jgi:hypothetical protein
MTAASRLADTREHDDLRAERARFEPGRTLQRALPRAVAASLTVLLHVAIVFALTHVTAGVETSPAPPSAHAITVDRLYTAGDRVVSVDIVSPAPTASGLACAGSRYVGIGVTADPRTERIILVGDDTPASRAGLQHDDIVLNPEVWQQSLREGMVLHVLVLRDRGKFLIPVRVGTICIG